MRKSKGNFTGWLQQVVSFSVHACMHAFTAGHWYMIWSMSRPRMDVRTYVRTYTSRRNQRERNNKTDSPQKSDWLIFPSSSPSLFCFSDTNQQNKRSKWPKPCIYGTWRWKKRRKHLHFVFFIFFSSPFFLFLGAVFFSRIDERSKFVKNDRPVKAMAAAQLTQPARLSSPSASQ